jgi:hypothetical protein
MAFPRRFAVVLTIFCYVRSASAFGVPSFVIQRDCRIHATISPSAARSSKSDNDNNTCQEEEPKRTRSIITPDILAAFAPAADPMYMCKGLVGDKEFVLTRTGEPTKEELTNENLVRIVRSECTDLEVNTLVWKCLGYRFDPETETWNPLMVFPKWKDKYPTPPDLIGMRRIYDKEVDQPSLKANQSLVRSVPVHAKQSLKTHLRPVGFKGYQYSELTPNKTRRAQCTNWLVYYREELFGYSLEALQEKKRTKQAEEENSNKKQDGEWKPPVTEVF